MCFSSNKPKPQPVPIQEDKEDLTDAADSAITSRELDAKKRRLAMSRAKTRLTGVGAWQGKDTLGG